jgi:multidrug resistance efflux pump
MTHPSDDEFTDAMWQHMQTVNTAATAKINDLRREVKQLRAEVDQEREKRYSIQEQLVQALAELERRTTLQPKFSIRESLARGPQKDPSHDH